MTPTIIQCLPVIKCLPRSDFLDGLTFWCPWCKKWHLHGTTDGSRVAHCFIDTPFKRTGYIVKKMTEAELKEIHKTIELYLERPKQ